MKTYVTKLTLGLASVGLLSACATTGQVAQTTEYDDLYFTASDRNTVEFTKLNDPKKAEYQQGSYVFDQQSFSSKNVNPEYIARYNNAGNQQNLQQEEGNALNDEYYVEEFEREDLRDNVDQPQVINNFYGTAPFSTFGNPAFNRWGGGFYDPFFDPFMMDPFFGPTAFGPGWGWGPGFNVGVNIGWGWGRPGWGFGNAWAFSPWRDPFFRPWGFRNAYAMGFYDGFYGGGLWNRPGVVVINNNEFLGVNRRRVTNGRNIQRVTRASANRNEAVVRGRNVGDRNAITSRNRADRNTVARSRGTRDFTRSQNEYYQRSRARVGSSGSTSRVYRSTTPASRSSRSYTSTEAARSSQSGSYSRSRSTSPSRSYSRGSYGSSSRSGSYSRGSYGGSRSGSYSRGSSSPSRSGSYSRGSYGGSRSSGSYSRGSSSGSRGGGSRGSRGGGGR
jgi:hypothetical protein